MVKVLTSLKKRDLLHNPEIKKNELSQYGNDYYDKNKLADALDFFQKAEDMDGVRRIMERSIEEGDPFLLQQTRKILKETISEEIWRKVGQKALDEGRFNQALTAFRSIPDENKIQEIEILRKSREYNAK